MRILLFSITLFLFACTGVSQNAEITKELKGPKAFQEQMDATEDFYLIDVRTPQEYQQGHIDGALNYNIMGDEFENQIAALDPNKVVFVYCAVGGRSARAANYLEEKGFKFIIDLKGGMKAWNAQ
tara:strand:+ start:9284 stop:9658 length:375 start_codon:yes stop_codon:yes gene_type:complete